jgi:hypothetical protein
MRPPLVLLHDDGALVGVLPSSVISRASATDRAISVCTVKISSSLRSYVFDQRWKPSAVLTS